MIVIWGPRRSGKVAQYAGQYATTVFIQLYYILPIAPVRGLWLVDPHRSAGHETALCGRSVAAGYIRGWGILGGGALALGGLATGTLIPIIVGLAMLGVVGWTYTWRAGRTARAEMRSDLNAAAFGTRCEPGLFMPEMLNERRHYLEQRWAAISDGKSPNDIAQFGATDPQRAVVAYGLLALAAVMLPGHARAEALADTWRIVDHMLAQPDRQLASHPYRAQLADVGQDSAAK